MPDIRVTIPAKLHSNIKVAAFKNGRTLADEIRLLLTSRYAEKIPTLKGGK